VSCHSVPRGQLSRVHLQRTRVVTDDNAGHFSAFPICPCRANIGVPSFPPFPLPSHSLSLPALEVGSLGGVRWTGRNKTVNEGKNCGLVLGRFWTKVLEIFGQCRRPFVLSNALVRLSVSRFVQKIFAIKCRRRRKTEQHKCKIVNVDSSNFRGSGRPQVFYGRLLARHAIHRLTKFG